MSDKELLNDLRAALAENPDLRANLYEIADDVAQWAKEISPRDEGTFIDSIEARRVNYKKLGKTTRVAKIVSTDDAAKVATLIHGRSADDPHGATPKYDIWNRVADMFNSPPDDE
ncbi:hypothetical protein QN239_19230 [Mycolicibacterium sp. Y3]